MNILKNRQGQYKYKMGINFFRLSKNTDYTLCLEILNTDYNLWDKSQISVDKGKSRGLSIGNVGIKNYPISILIQIGEQKLCTTIE